MSDDEKKKAHEAAHAIVDEMVERDAEDIGYPLAGLAVVVLAVFTAED